jgi:hypothetical protein
MRWVAPHGMTFFEISRSGGPVYIVQSNRAYGGAAHIGII